MALSLSLCRTPKHTPLTASATLLSLRRLLKGVTGIPCLNGAFLTYCCCDYAFSSYIMLAASLPLIKHSRCTSSPEILASLHILILHWSRYLSLYVTVVFYQLPRHTIAHPPLYHCRHCTSSSHRMLTPLLLRHAGTTAHPPPKLTSSSLFLLLSSSYPLVLLLSISPTFSH